MVKYLPAKVEDTGSVPGLIPSPGGFHMLRDTCLSPATTEPMHLEAILSNGKSNNNEKPEHRNWSIAHSLQLDKACKQQ